MGEAKPTPGECRCTPRAVDESGNWASRIPFAIEIAVGAAVIPVADVCAQPQAEANAALITEAFNVHNTTGLTPSQLVERVKELEELLKHVQASAIDQRGADFNLSPDWWAKFHTVMSKARPNTAEGEAAQQAPAGAAEIEELRALSVTNIMIDVVPGDDGMGHEVYAKSVDDVVNKLTAMGAELEDWQLGIRRYEHSPTAQAAPAAAKEPSP